MIPIILFFSSRQISAHPIRNFRSSQSTPGRFDNIELTTALLESAERRELSKIFFMTKSQRNNRLPDVRIEPATVRIPGGCASDRATASGKRGDCIHRCFTLLNGRNWSGFVLFVCLFSIVTILVISKNNKRVFSS